MLNVLEGRTNVSDRVFKALFNGQWPKWSTHVCEKVLWKHGPKCLFGRPKSSYGEHKIARFFGRYYEVHVGNNICETYPRRIGQGLNDKSCMRYIMGLPNLASGSLANVVRRRLRRAAWLEASCEPRRDHQVRLMRTQTASPTGEPTRRGISAA